MREIRTYGSMSGDWKRSRFGHRASRRLYRVEVAAAARRRAMTLYYGTANGPQHSGCGQIGSPEG